MYNRHGVHSARALDPQMALELMWCCEVLLGPLTEQPGHPAVKHLFSPRLNAFFLNDL